MLREIEVHMPEWGGVRARTFFLLSPFFLLSRGRMSSCGVRVIEFRIVERKETRDVSILLFFLSSSSLLARFAARLADESLHDRSEKHPLD